MARYFVDNGIYFQDSTIPKTILKYTNETTRRLYCNKFDLFPDVYAAKYGAVAILKNGIKEFTSKSADGATNPLRRYLQYSVSDRLRSLDREDSLEIVLEQNKEDVTTKLGISLELDFTDAPGPAQNITRDPLSLSTISEEIVLADRLALGPQHTDGHELPFDMTGYSKIILSITVNHDYDPVESYNTSNPPPQAWLDEIDGSYRSNPSSIVKHGVLDSTSGTDTVYWEYANENLWAFRYRDGTTFNPAAISGSYVSAAALYETNNPEKENRQFAVVFSIPDHFDFDVSYTWLKTVREYRNRRYISRLYRYYHTFTFISTGKRLTGTKTQNISILGYDLPDLSDQPTEIRQILAAPHTEITAELATNKRYIRFVCTVDYAIVVADIASSTITATGLDRSNWDYESLGDRTAGFRAFINSLPAAGAFVPPDSTLGYFNPHPTFPARFPATLHNFQRSDVLTDAGRGQFIISQFGRLPAQVDVITLALQYRAPGGQWFTLIENLGAISALGQTTLTLSDDDFNRNVVFPHGQDALRIVVNTNLPTLISIAATLTN